MAAGIWVLVKLPQEYWIHVAQPDFTDTWRDVPWFAPVITLGALALLAFAWFVVRPRLPAADHGWTVAPPPLPAEMDSAAERDAWTAAHVRLWSWWTAEKVLLIGLLSTIYARILPDLEVSDLRMFVGVSVFVVVNAAISLAVARRIGSRTRLGATSAARVGLNVGLVLVTPVTLVALAAAGDPARSWAVLGGAVAYGLALLVGAVVLGGRRLDRRAPEMLGQLARAQF